MNLSFGAKWFRARREFTEPWDRQTAEKAHDNREPYAVLIERNGRAECFLEFNKDYVGVGFFDENMREVLSYQFQEMEPGKLFLTMATHRKFKGASDRVESGATYFFKPNGRANIEEEIFPNGPLTSGETTFDPNQNWESYPEFAEYAAIIRRER